MIKRTLVLIDGANLHHVLKDLGFEVDFNLLRNWLCADSDVLRIYFYTAVLEGSTWLEKKLEWMEWNGFTVRSKPAKHIGSGYKGNMDVEMAVDAMNLIGHYTDCIIFSGDGDLKCLVEALQFKGVRVTIVHTKKIRGLAHELARQADRFIDLDSIRDQITPNVKEELIELEDWEDPLLV